MHVAPLSVNRRLMVRSASEEYPNAHVERLALSTGKDEVTKIFLWKGTM
jgi:hypothetical protein